MTPISQLNASCYMLHDIFIRKSVADRMEIIATDRRIQYRRLAKEAEAAAALSARLKSCAITTTRPSTPLTMAVASRQRLSSLAKVTL